MITTRYLQIVFFFGRATLSTIAWDLLLPRLGGGALSRRTRPARMRALAARFRTMAIRMGGVLIKVGQFFSARVDVLPREIIEELSGLQDEVPPEPFDRIRALAEAELGAPLPARFASFESAPLAAASLGQVHRAKLRPEPPSGEPGSADILDVVVKIQRPGIERLIETDLRSLRTVAGWLERYQPIRKRADVRGLLGEFSRTLYEEIDYLAEGRNAETFAANFRGDPGVRVPRVIWSHTTRRVLTLEDVYAIKITDYAAIAAAGIPRAEVAERLFKTYLKQIFDDSFFHADPHPGNLFVSPLGPPGASPREWQLTFVDFGMAGRIAPHVREGARELVIGVGTQDAARVVKAYQTLGVLLPSADLELLERAEARMFERFWGKSMSDLRNMHPREMHEFAGEFQELVYDLPFQVPQDLILVGRCLAILSGMCTGLDPEFNVFAGLIPFAQKLLAAEARTGWQSWVDEAIDLGRGLVALPRRFDQLLARLERGEFGVRAPETDRRLARLERAGRRATWAVLSGAMLLGGIQVYLAGKAGFAAILLGGAALALVGVLLSP